MTKQPIPLIILGGSDGRPGSLPKGVENRRTLGGYKAAQLQIGGKPIVQHLLDRMAPFDLFGPTVIAGPAAVYQEAGITAPLIDTDSSMGTNIQVAIETVRKDYPQGPIGFITCDVIPEPDDLTLMLEDYLSTPTDLWYPLIKAPEAAEAMGASDYKPRYRLPPGPGAPAIPVLPGHLVIADTEACRLDFLYRLIDTGYATRNSSIAARRWKMVAHMLGAIGREELSALARFEVPSMTYRAVRYGLGTAKGLAAGTASVPDLENALDHLFIQPRWRKQFPERTVRTPILNAFSLAKDIDTEEEAREKGAGMVSTEG